MKKGEIPTLRQLADTIGNNPSEFGDQYDRKMMAILSARIAEDLKDSIAAHAEAIREGGRAADAQAEQLVRYTRGLQYATWALVVTTVVLVGVTLWKG